MWCIFPNAFLFKLPERGGSIGAYNFFCCPIATERVIPSMRLCGTWLEGSLCGAVHAVCARLFSAGVHALSACWCESSAQQRLNALPSQGHTLSLFATPLSASSPLPSLPPSSPLLSPQQRVSHRALDAVWPAALSEETVQRAAVCTPAQQK